MSQRLEFVEMVQQRRRSISELCGLFGISEKTAYKWLRRYHVEGVPGLADRSHAPHQAAHQLTSQVMAAIVALRERHPTWGPRKLRAILATRHPTARWPATSTIGELLRRRGLIHARRRRSPGRYAPWKRLDAARTTATAPNELWTADFKGQFRLQTGAYCYPLTVLDAHSRFLLSCTALTSTGTLPSYAVFRRLFEEYGLPRVIRTDNGCPFAASTALARLSTLAVWWIRLGIRPERIQPGHPQQNGQHERLHKTLKAEATRPASASVRDQQRRFVVFQREYNDERPHEALGQQPPGRVYVPSPRTMPRRPPSLNIPGRLRSGASPSAGSSSRGESIYLSEALDGEDVALEETANDHWRVLFGPLILGRYDPTTITLTPECYWITETNG